MKAGESKHYWFPAKRYGWGWGLPTIWQGWAVLLVYASIIALLLWQVPPRVHLFLFIALVVAASVLLVLVGCIKGEPPSWRWGN